MMFKLLILLAAAAGLWFWWLRKFGRPGSMPTAEARELLNLHVGATADEIRAAHRQMIARVHPDAGGSAGLATRVNAARDTLLAELKRRS